MKKINKLFIITASFVLMGSFFQDVLKEKRSARLMR